MTQDELKLVFNALKQCTIYAFAGGLGVRATAHTDALAILEKALAQTEQEPVTMQQIEAFANLVAAKEREACAKIVEDSPSYDWHKFACEAAAAIRARGEQA